MTSTSSIESVPAQGTYALAGRYAKAWFDRMGRGFANLRTEHVRQLENEILDCALADAGVTPLEIGMPVLTHPDDHPGHSVRV